MKKISIDELNDMVDSRYSLVTIISKRARQIIDGSQPLVKSNTKKPVGIAIEEFYEEKYKAIYDYDKYKKALEAEMSEAETAMSEAEADNAEEAHGQEE